MLVIKVTFDLFNKVETSLTFKMTHSEIKGHLHIVKYLIEKRYMNLNFKDSKTKLTGLQLAAINNQHEILEYLLSFNSSSLIKDSRKVHNIFTTNNQAKHPRASSKLCAQNLEIFNADVNKIVSDELR